MDNCKARRPDSTSSLYMHGWVSITAVSAYVCVHECLRLCTYVCIFLKVKNNFTPGLVKDAPTLQQFCSKLNVQQCKWNETFCKEG